VELKKKSGPSTPTKTIDAQKSADVVSALPTPAASPTVTVVIKTEAASSASPRTNGSVETPGSDAQLMVSKVVSVE